MKNKINIHYDEEGDILEIQIGEPTPSYYEEIKEGIFERIDEKTGEIRGFAIFSFRERIKKEGDINIPLAPRANVNAEQEKIILGENR
jgi:uncharacterized protein YuzE